MFSPPVAKPKSAPPGRSAAVQEQPWLLAQHTNLTRNESGVLGNEDDAAQITGREAAPSWDFSKTPLFASGRAERNQAPPISVPRFSGPMQAKLKVGAVNDPLKHEADRVADAVTRMPAPVSPRASVPPQVSRKCAARENDDERLQKKADGPQAAGGEAPGIVREALRSPGQPLDTLSRAYFEPRFGRDFSQVRVHTGVRAAESARAVNALAYTVGKDVVFGCGHYEPGSRDGKRLLAHELTHVAQQSETSQHTAMVQRQSSGSGSGSSPASASVFHPGVNHDHKPSGRWADVQANPNSGFWENRICANYSFQEVIGIAMYAEFSDKPVGLQHLLWYLTGGGADFVEDANLDSMLRTDTGVQALVAKLIPSTAPASGKFTGHVKVEQANYRDQDFRFSFGAIDRLDCEVDFAAGTVHVWFQDRYEWHPFYPGLYAAFSDDSARETNCVHAALVEEKTQGAADFWMKGEATVPLSLFQGGTPPPHPHPKGAGGLPVAPL
jgi:hypothetical protein